MGFGREVGRISSKHIDEAIDLRKNVIYELFSSVVLLTRVDTGRARGNWIFSDRAPNYQKSTEATDKSGQVTLSKIYSQVSGEDGIYHLNNNVPYIGFLEELDGMMNKSVRRIDGILRRKAK